MQMAPPGSLLGSIQTTTQATAMQVTASPSQTQQLQTGSSQTISLPTPQQVPLPPTVPAIKMEHGEIHGADSLPLMSQVTDSKDNILEGWSI